MARDVDIRQTTMVDRFLADVARTPAPVSRNSGKTDRRNRMIFALDATMSRQPTWDRASHVQAEMFDVTTALGGIEVQIAFFRGFQDFRVSPFLDNAKRLAEMMGSVSCQGGQTQITRVMQHALKQHRQQPVAAFIYIGDSMEEDADALCHLAGQMGLEGLRGFFFQEGNDAGVEPVFRQMAKLTGGAWCRFDSGSAAELADLLRGVAIWAAGGLRALGDAQRRKMISPATAKLLNAPNP